MMPRPPTSTLFPYTTLFRSVEEVAPGPPVADPGVQARSVHEKDVEPAVVIVVEEGGAPPHLLQRSEEHTSELQSHSDLVCRLLLEKKKTKESTVAIDRTSSL